MMEDEENIFSLNEKLNDVGVGHKHDKEGKGDDVNERENIFSRNEKINDVKEGENTFSKMKR